MTPTETAVRTGEHEQLAPRLNHNCHISNDIYLTLYPNATGLELAYRCGRHHCEACHGGAALAWYISPVDREARVVAFYLKRNTSYRSAYTLDWLGSFLADRLPVNGSARALSQRLGYSWPRASLLFTTSIVVMAVSGVIAAVTIALLI
jgi:hypothetical protein